MRQQDLLVNVSLNFLGILIIISGYIVTAYISCRNEAGQPVDWYILYKEPKVGSRNGLRYWYMDERANGWVRGQHNINDSLSAVAQTLKPLYDHYETKIGNFGCILYSDQPPKERYEKKEKTVSDTFGHSKGVVLLDNATGIWLSHSTPKFPGNSIESFWPQSGQANGQTFICGTYNYSTFKDIGLQLKHIHIKPFGDSQIPESFYYELRCLLEQRCYPKMEPYYRRLNMTTRTGHNFVSYAKYRKLNDDLYAAVLNEHMGGDFYVKSWGKRNPLPSNCSVPNHVFNVRTVKLPSLSHSDVTRDHSKWCVTKENSSTPWTCIADMNRAVKQKSRGGGAVCTDNPVVWEAFVNLVNSYQPCTQHLREL